STTISGETLKPGGFELSLREDFTQFEHFSRSEAEKRAEKSGDFDALDHGFLTTASLAYGLVEDFQIEASLGYFIGREFVGAERQDDGTVESGTADPAGVTDLLVSGKYRFLQGEPGNLAVVGGVKFPTGKDDVRLSSGEKISPSDQPGTGAFDF